MPRGWYKQAYLQVFDLHTAPLNKSINMFEFMGIIKKIYKEIFLNPSKKQLKGQMKNMMVLAVNIEEKPSILHWTPRRAALEITRQETHKT